MCNVISIEELSYVGEVYRVITFICNVIYVQVLSCKFVRQVSSTFKNILPYAYNFNPLKPELNPICHLLALLGSATIVVVSMIRLILCML
jgi:hypothetical protein